MNSFSLQGKVAIVTGGTRGIGLAIVCAYLKHGAQVVLTGQTQRSLDAARDHLELLENNVGAHENWLGLTANFADSDAPGQVIQKATQHFGRIDILVNNAGVIGPSDMWETDMKEWDFVQDVNVKAVFLCAREASKAMITAGNGGSIVNISSVAAQIGGSATGPAYVASKAAQLGLTRSLARQLAPHRIRVNCVAPADIETDMLSDWPDALKGKLVQMTPLARFGSPDEVATAAVFLGSEAASYVTGQTLNVNGGLYMG